MTTTEPGVQFYAGVSLDGSFKSSSGWAYAKNTGLCLETQRLSGFTQSSFLPHNRIKAG